MQVTAPSAPTLPPSSTEAKPDAPAPAAAQDAPPPSDAAGAAQNAPPPPNDAAGAPATPTPTDQAPADDAPAAPYRSPLRDWPVDPTIASKLMQAPTTAQPFDSVQSRQGQTSANPDDARDQNGGNPQGAASGGNGNQPQAGMAPPPAEPLPMAAAAPTDTTTAVDAGAGSAGAVPSDSLDTVSPADATTQPFSEHLRIPKLMPSILLDTAESVPVAATDTAVPDEATASADTGAAVDADAGTAEAVPVDPLDTVSPADATAPTNAVDSTTSAPAPTAVSMEATTYELILADPDIQDIIKNFGGPLELAGTKNGVEQGIVERCGPDLAARLNQLQTAQREVQKQYLETLTQAIRHTAGPQPGYVFFPIYGTGDVDLGPIPPGIQALGGGEDIWHYSGDENGNLGYSVLDPVAFTNAWSQGDSPLQKAFRTLYGDQALGVGTSYSGGDGGGYSSYLTLAGKPLQITPTDNEYYTTRFGVGLAGDATMVNPSYPVPLYNNDAVWFDPQFGWTTDIDNVKVETDLFDKVMPAIFGGVMSFITGGALSAAFSPLVSTVGAAVVGSAATQMAANDKINFGTLLKDAVSAGVMNIAGLNATGGSAGEIAVRITERAGVQGVLEQLSGGKFLDGALQGGLGGLANEVSKQLNAAIDKKIDLSASESSMLKVLTRASASAIRALGNPDDPAAGFASDFLSSLIPQVENKDEASTVRQEGGAENTTQPVSDTDTASDATQADDPTPSDNPLGDFIAAIDGQDDPYDTDSVSETEQDGADNTPDVDAPDDTAPPTSNPTVIPGGTTSIAGWTTPEQTDDLVRIIAAAQDPTQQISSGVPRSPFNFLAAFDGTNNNKDDLPLSGSPLQTNVANIYNQALSEESDGFRTRYYPGVGTGGINGGIMGAGPFPTQYVNNAAEKAYAEFVEQADRYLNENQDAGATYHDISASVTGFSRGSLTGVVFAQMVNDRGLVRPDGTQIAPPGSISINGMALMDPVATGIQSDLSLPPNVQGRVLVVTAQNEDRAQFRLADYSGDDRVLSIEIPANHAGVGGGYDQNGTAAAVLEIITAYLQKSGANVAPVPVNQRFDPTTTAPIYTEDYYVHIAANGDVSTTKFTDSDSTQPDGAWLTDKGPRRAMPMPVDPAHKTDTPNIIR